MTQQNQSELADIYAEIKPCFKSHQNQFVVGSLKQKFRSYTDVLRISQNRDVPAQQVEQGIYYKSRVTNYHNVNDPAESV